MSEEAEKKLKNKFISLVDNDFRVVEDVVGQDLVHQRKVRIDFLLYPNQHLVDIGFDPVLFGVEVKHFGIPGETGKMSRFIWQCITYTQSSFQIDGLGRKPAFVLGFSDVFDVNQNSDELNKEHLCQLTGMLRLAGLAHVGTFSELMPSRNRPLGGWSISFSSSLYFRRIENCYEKTQYNIFKENVGNCSS